MIGDRVEENATLLVIRGAKQLNAVQTGERCPIVTFVKDCGDSRQTILVHLAREGKKEVGIRVVAVATVNRLADLLSLDVDPLGEVKCVLHTDKSVRVFINVKPWAPSPDEGLRVLRPVRH